MRKLHTLTLLTTLGLGACTGGTGEGGVGGAHAELMSVPEVSNGISTIEAREVHYQGDRDEGSLEFTLIDSLCIPGEFCLQGLEGAPRARFEWSRARNVVDVYLDFAPGELPYRPTYEKRFDDSTEFNPQMTRVEDAHWQFWMIGAMLGRHRELAYYDLETMRFIGTRYDFEPIGPRPFPAEGTYTTIEVQTTRMLCSPMVEGNPDGSAHFHFQFAFDRMEDADGTPGVIAMILPFDLCHPDHLTNYWTQQRLPDDVFMSFDTFLDSMADGDPIGIASSAEPFPKPASLAWRDNTFIGWGNIYPASIPSGFHMNFRAGGHLQPASGRNEQLDPWFPSELDLCPWRSE